MFSTSSPFPYVPLEVKHHILRFCDPYTLAKTAQVSLAFLELSSPILYEDVRIHGIEGLKRLFSRRTTPPSPQTAPFLSLSQIRDISIACPFDDLERDDFSDLVSDREPSNSYLAVRTLKIQVGRFVPPFELHHLGGFLNPHHLVVAGPRDTGASIVLEPTSFSSLDTILLVRVAVADQSLGQTARRAGWILRCVTFDLPERDDAEFGALVESMFGDLPLPEPAEVVVLVKSEGDKEELLQRVQSAVDEGG